MNIFDGFEEKTPKELAQELGVNLISKKTTADLSNSLDNNPGKTKVKLTQREQEGWIDKYNIEDLEVGIMVLKGESLGIIFQINKMIKKIGVKRIDGKMDFDDYSYDEFLENHAIDLLTTYEAFQRKGEWTNITSIDEIKPGMKFRNDFILEVTIKKIKEIKRNYYILKTKEGIDIPISTDNLSDCKIFVTKDMKRISPTSIDNLKKDTKVKSKYSGETGVITEIMKIDANPENDKVIIKRLINNREYIGSDNYFIINITEFYKTFQILVDRN